MIPRYQRILFWSLVAGILLMAAFLLHGCQQAHKRLAALNDATPIAAPTTATISKTTIHFRAAEPFGSSGNGSGCRRFFCGSAVVTPSCRSFSLICADSMKWSLLSRENSLHEQIDYGARYPRINDNDGSYLSTFIA